jgi:hypothetical protein
MNKPAASTQMTKTLQDRIVEAEQLGNRYLADANEAAEKGKTEKAEKLYEKGQYWLDRLNKLQGWN